MMLVSPSEPVVEIRRLIRAPIARVFAAWSEPASLAAWMRPGAFVDSEVQVDFRVGGSYRIVMRDRDGGTYLHHGVYTEIAAPERIAFTWHSQCGGTGESDVTIALRTIGDATEVLLRHRRLSDEQARQSHAAGWTEILGNLDRRLGGGAPTSA